jgi:hypothetical protein
LDLAVTSDSRALSLVATQNPIIIFTILIIIFNLFVKFFIFLIFQKTLWFFFDSNNCFLKFINDNDNDNDNHNN